MLSQFMRFDDQHLGAFSKNANRFMIWGVILMILGVLAVSFSSLSTLITVTAIGFLLLFTGAVMLIDTLTFWWNKWSGFFIHLFYATLYLIVGIILLNNPIEGSISITLLLGIFYMVIGIIRIFFSTLSKLPHWGWSLFNGIITTALGLLILASWPESSIFIIGLFVGIDLFFSGWAYFMTALAAKSMLQR